MLKKSFFLLSFFSCFVLTKAQEDHLSSLFTVSLNYQFEPKYFLLSEVQMRGNQKFGTPDYYELKAGLGYNLAKNNKALLGIGRYANYAESELSKEEFRLWLQDVINIQQGKLKIENRFRAEQSWFYEPKTQQHSQRQRFRYRLNLIVPLVKSEDTNQEFSANAYDEVFLVSSSLPHFARNRIFLGFSYKFSDKFTLSPGYLWQRDFGLNANQNYHYIALSCGINLK